MVPTPMKVRFQACQLSTVAQESFAQEVLTIHITASSKSSEHEEASSPKKPHEAESGTSVTALVQSPRVSGQWRSRARRRIHRSPFASRAKSSYSTIDGRKQRSLATCSGVPLVQMIPALLLRLGKPESILWQAY